MINILSLHEEPTADGHLENSICCDRTVLASIFQLRPWMGFDKGCVMWLAMGHPCSQVFVPWYAGIQQAPEGMGRFKSPMEAEMKHMSNTKDKRKNYPNHFYWKYIDGWDISADPSEKQREIFKERRKFEKGNDTDFDAFIRKFY
jgi:hypothetical protein